MPDYAEEFTHAGKRIRIYQDTEPMNPRTDYDHLATMVAFHPRYNLGDEKHGYVRESFSSGEELKEAIERDHDPAAILPLFLLDHSGITIRTGIFHEDPGGWDTSFVGFIFVSKKKAREEFGKPTKTNLKKVEDCLEAEVKEYAQYLEGDVWGYTISHNETCDKCEHTECVNEDSCWGFYGYEYCEEEAKRAAEYEAKRASTTKGDTDAKAETPPDHPTRG